MTAFTVADSVIGLRLAPSAPRCLRDFLARITDPRRGRSAATHLVEIHGSYRAGLQVDGAGRWVRLDLPPADALPGGQAHLEIAVLQATARALALMRSDEVLLLHGGAVTLDGGRSAIAVLDGGLGQGKTSLALGLARCGGRLLVDEFAFTDVRGWPSVVPLPTWPWHVRHDMAPLLAPGATGPLLYRDDLAPLTFNGRKPVPLRLILIPDRALSAGTLAAVGSRATPALLRPAVTDHARKLRDPALDHISIFTSAADVDLGGHRRAASCDDEAVQALAAVSLLRVGIGAPHDLPSTVAAVMNHLLVEAA